MAGESPNLGFNSERFDYQFTIAGFGEIREGTVAAALPSVACKVVYLKTPKGNAGTVYIGGATVAKEGTVTNTTAGWPLAAGESFGPLQVANTNLIYAVSDGTADNLNYWAFI